MIKTIKAKVTFYPKRKFPMEPSKPPIREARVIIPYDKALSYQICMKSGKRMLEQLNLLFLANYVGKIVDVPYNQEIYVGIDAIQ